ncbi:uncharacterized protein BP5553_07223 [Venustampulla echinocandica]|uniref:Uncharacterized protein n=1 Tax=Venustampulla echinocandica TaxID=2656787 RepID=A0A370TIX5_9HELO|nr:uncharacterized protein BP5553_07223 [Venustampulla echinocandica]RDL35292.1 hypothetical protein BP5553_07223 [Venustampulla echinocandica]
MKLVNLVALLASTSAIAVAHPATQDNTFVDQAPVNDGILGRALFNLYERLVNKLPAILPDTIDIAPLNARGEAGCIPLGHGAFCSPNLPPN